jgi:predicted ATPase
MSEINEIRRQFQQGHWQKFINSVTIDKLRGWDNQTVEFRFPICAITGENGSGKSTVLRSIVCAYQNTLRGSKTFYPAQLFLRTPWDEPSVPRDSLLKYSIKQGTQLNESRWKKAQDWGYSPKGHRPERNVVFLDISRTLPLDATAGYAKIARSTAEIISGEVSITADMMREYAHIMGGDYIAGKFVAPQANREVGILTGANGEISQFHLGAGEDFLLDLIKIMQTIPEMALVVIDEVEASLHPKAQRRLVRFLSKLTRTKKLQIVLSTHSPYILDEIPPEGRILIQKLHDGSRDVQYCVSTKYAMGAIDDERHPDLFVYVEDKESKILLEEMLKRDESLFKRILIKEVGDQEVVKTIGRLCRNNKLNDPGIAVLDGDSGEDANGNCLRLPSDKTPEELIFTGMKDKGWYNLDKRFGLGAGSLFSIFDDAITCPDHHDITTTIGDKISKSKDIVWQYFVEEWCKQCLDSDVADVLIQRINEKLQGGVGNA